MKDRIRVVLVDDHEIVRLGLKTLLGDMTWIDVVGEAGTAAEALIAVSELLPDVVVMDIRMPGESGVTACERIVAKWPQTKVIVLTSFEEDALIFDALRAGASGYVLKQVGNQPLIDALDAVRRGAALLDPSVTLRLIEHIRYHESQMQTEAFRELSLRELTVLYEVSLGKSNGQIAQALDLSEKTVRNHVSAILAKLGLVNRIEAATYAVRHSIEQHLPES